MTAIYPVYIPPYLQYLMVPSGLRRSQVRKKKMTASAIAADYNQEFCVADLVEIAGPPANALQDGPGPLLGVVMGKTDRALSGIPLNWSGDFWDVLVGGTVTPISVMWMTPKRV